MRQEVWYPLAGFFLLAMFTEIVAAVVKLPGGKKAAVAGGKGSPGTSGGGGSSGVQQWFTWGLSVLAMLLMLVSGLYVTRDTWIEHLFVKLVGLSPWVLLIVGLGMLWLVGMLVLGTVPDQWVTITLSSGLILVAFILPTWVKHALPPGEIAQQAGSLVNWASDQMSSQTDGWFI